MNVPPDAERLRRSVRVTAALTAVLGALVAVTAGLNHGLIALLNATPALAGATPAPALPPYVQMAFAFALRATPYILALGAVFVVGGGWALRRPARAPMLLRRTAEFGVLDSLVLAGLWWLVAAEHGAHPVVYAVGIFGHLLQGGLIVKAWLFLGRPEVVQAAALSPSDGR